MGENIVAILRPFELVINELSWEGVSSLKGENFMKLILKELNNYSLVLATQLKEL